MQGNDDAIGTDMAEQNEEHATFGVAADVRSVQKKASVKKGAGGSVQKNSVKKKRCDCLHKNVLPRMHISSRTHAHTHAWIHPHHCSHIL